MQQDRGEHGERGDVEDPRAVVNPAGEDQHAEGDRCDALRAEPRHEGLPDGPYPRACQRDPDGDRAGEEECAEHDGDRCPAVSEQAMEGQQRAEDGEDRELDDLDQLTGALREVATDGPGGGRRSRSPRRTRR